MPPIFTSMQQLGADLTKEYDLGSDTAPTPGTGTDVVQPPAPPALPETPAIPGGAPIGPYQTAAPVAPEQPTSGSKPPKSTGPGYTPNIQPYEAPTTSDFYRNLFNPVSSDVTKQRNTLTNAASTFAEQAGGSRGYEALGGAGIVGAAFGPQAGSEQKKAAGELLGAQYGGPRGLDQKALDELIKGYEPLRARGESLMTGAGVEDLLARSTPGLSRGALRFEAERLMADPEYQRLARLYQGEIGGLEGEIKRQREGAESFATQRKGEEEAIQKSAREAFTGRRGELEEILRGRVSTRQTEQQALRDAYDRFAASGNLEDLAAIDPEFRAAFENENIGLLSQAKTEYGNVMQNFEDIGDVPLMTMTISSHGHERRDFPPEWYEANKGKYTKNQLRDLKARAKERQLALEAAGFSPDVKKTGGKKYRVNEGRFAKVMPLYFGDDDNLLDTQLAEYALPDIRSYVGLEEGSIPTADLLASAEERDLYNYLGEALGENARLGIPGDEYYGGGLTGNAEGFQNEITGAVAARQAELDAAEREFSRRAKKTRKRYKAEHTLGARFGKKLGQTIGSESVGEYAGGIVQGGLEGDIKTLAGAPFKAPSVGLKAAEEVPTTAVKRAQKTPSTLTKKSKRAAAKGKKIAKEGKGG